jgi:hypothetical protein
MSLKTAVLSVVVMLFLGGLAIAEGENATPSPENATPPPRQGPNGSDVQLVVVPAPAMAAPIAPTEDAYPSGPVSASCVRTPERTTEGNCQGSPCATACDCARYRAGGCFRATIVAEEYFDQELCKSVRSQGGDFASCFRGKCGLLVCDPEVSAPSASGTTP